MLVQSRTPRHVLIREARARRAIMIRLARTDVNTFVELVGRDERTNDPVVQAPVHVAWHREMDLHDRLVIWAHIEAGKTFQVSVMRTLHELGRNPELRFLLLSNTQRQARKVAQVLRSYIESSPDLHDVFPDLLPGEPWGEQAFSVKRATHAKDPSVQTSGIHGNVQGSRLDRIVFDDVLDYENSRTQEGRQDIIDWWNSAPAGRLTEGAKVRGVGTAFHPQDLLHWFARQTGVWTALRYPVVDPQTGEPRWPERWPFERIVAKRAEMAGNPAEFARQLMCEARDDSVARFPRAAIELALRLGEGQSLASALNVVPPGYRTYTGVDLAVQQRDASDSTCLFTIASDPYGVRRVLNCESGKWSGPEIVRRIHDAHVRYQSIIIVENNAAQDFIVQFARQGAATPIIPFTTGRNKAHPEHGVESMAVEMMSGKWQIPNRAGQCHSEIQSWIDEMLFYQPDQHTGDRLMASWFAREGVRLGNRAVEPVTSGSFTRR